MAKYEENDYTRTGENTATSFENIETSKETEFHDEIWSRSVPEEILREILRAFYKQIGVDIISFELNKDLRTYIKNQYKKLGCCNIRSKHLDSPNSKLVKILSKYNIVPQYETFSIVGTYKNVSLSEKVGGPLKTIY